MAETVFLVVVANVEQWLACTGRGATTRANDGIVLHPRAAGL